MSCTVSSGAAFAMLRSGGPDLDSTQMDPNCLAEQKTLCPYGFVQQRYYSIFINMMIRYDLIRHWILG